MPFQVLPGVLTETYVDAAEDELLALFSAKKKREIALEAASWPVRYHLDPRRSKIVDWYPFTAGAHVLEVGAGCGAITEALVRMNVEVTALELTEKRALINAHRNKAAKNLTVIAGNLADLEPTQRYDYIVCIGVLEYSALFIPGNQPFTEFLSSLKRHLKKGGVLLLAIENQLGLKYFAGAPEDHTGGYMDGLNDYPHPQTPRTFGRGELQELFVRAGFAETYFYYPFPDYKLPSIIYSDDYYPGQPGVKFPKNFLPTPVVAMEREELFTEAAAMMILERNDLFREHANSFLVEAKI